MRYVLGLPPMSDRGRIGKVLPATSLLIQAIETCSSMENLRREEAWIAIDNEDELLTIVALQ